MSQPFALSFSGTVGSDGTATITVLGWNAGALVNSWNASIQAPRGVVTIRGGATVIGGPIPLVNGSASLGPCQSAMGEQVTVSITGGLQGDAIVGSIVGMAFDNYDELSSSGLGFSNVGAVQSDPSQLLTAQIGPPLVENQTYAVPGSGSHSFFAGDFSIGGYSALLLYGKCPNAAAGTALYICLLWEDQFGNVIATSQIDCLSPQFICFFGALGSRVSIILGNTSAGQVNVNSVTVIPFTSMPADPGRFIPIGFSAPVNFQVTQVPPANAIVSFNSSVAASTTVNIPGDFVWYGEALWTVSPVSVGTGGVNTWWAQLQTTDASGNVTLVDVITGQNVGGANGPRQVFLPSGTPQVNFRNLGAAAITPVINLLAA